MKRERLNINHVSKEELKEIIHEFKFHMPILCGLMDYNFNLLRQENYPLNTEQKCALIVISEMINIVMRLIGKENYKQFAENLYNHLKDAP